MSSPGTLTIVTDASHAQVDDGFGGYAFFSGAPGTVFFMSESWPTDIKAALDAAATARSTRQQREAGDEVREPERLSMPAAETFAAIALASSASSILGGNPSSVIAIGDCAPAAAALSALYSAAPQIRYLTGVAASISTRWLGVAVSREVNTMADTLSHPSKKEEVIRTIRAKGFTPQPLTVSAALWEAARHASTLPLKAGDKDADSHEIEPPRQPPSHPAHSRP